MTLAISCPIIGAGTIGDPYRPIAANYGVNWAAAITTDAAGAPTDTACLAIVAGNLDAMLLDPDIELVAITPDRNAPDGSAANILAGLQVSEPA